jgi:molybdate transport system substrate-binding protein
MRPLLRLLLLFTGLLLQAKTVTVAAAANVSYAMTELSKAFRKEHSDTEIRVIVGSSGKLTAQIRHGAPYQLFLSADMDYPEALRKSGEAVTEPRVYARGALVLFSATPRDLGEGLDLLKSPEIKKVAMANPRTAPYGRAAKEALEKSGLMKAVKPKLIYGESVSQTVAYALRAADAGLIAKAPLFSPKLRSFREGKNWIDVDPSLYHPIDQGVVLLKPGAGDPAARDFYDFLLGPEARKILRRYGYLLP